MKIKNTILLLFLSFTLIFSATDKYRLILADDPSSTITIAWNQLSGENPIVYYDTSDHGENLRLYAFSHAVDQSKLYHGMNNQFARLSHLLPNTAYYFLIKDSQSISKRYWFKTSPSDKSRLSFIAGGDSRSNREPRQRANLLVSKLKPNAVFFGGDMTSRDTKTEWQDWLDDWQFTTAKDGRMFPIIPAQGNHEGHEVIYNLFDSPNKAYYYALTFGDDLFRLYTLNTEISVSGNQLTWFKNDLKQYSETFWKSAIYHKPMRPHTAGKGENVAVYDAWAKLFFDKGVRLLIECDAHTVKQTWPIEPSLRPGNDEGFIQNNTVGCVYIGEGGWGAPLRDNNNDKSWTRDSGKFYQFKLLFIDSSKIEIRTIITDNAEEVDEVSNTNAFNLPKNLNVWSPENGKVVTLFPAHQSQKSKIAFAQETSMFYIKGQKIKLKIDVLNKGEKIKNVRFYVNHIHKKKDIFSPYSFKQFYKPGQYLVEAVASGKKGFISSDTIILNVGHYQKTDTTSIKNGQDDVEETEAGLIHFASSDLELMYDDFTFFQDVPNGFHKVGLRFQDVQIPTGAVIDSAYIQFSADESDDKDVEYYLYIENSGNTAPFDDGNILRVSARETVQDSVHWTPSPWKESQSSLPQRTPDMSHLLQKIIDRIDWKQGNAVSFIVKGAGVTLTDATARRVAESYEVNSKHAAKLIYTYHF